MAPKRPPNPTKPLPAEAKAADRKQPSTKGPAPAREPQNQVHYTVFIRLPFPRGEFTDPPLVDWGPAKERALWARLSRMVKGDDVDWQTLADEFDVTLQFLLQQAAWLYERQLSQVRAQMRKVGHSNTSAAASPVAGSASASTTAAGYPMKRAPSGTGSTNAPSGGYSMRRDNSGGGPYSPLPGGYPMRRDGSAGTGSPAVGGAQSKRDGSSGGKAALTGGQPMRRDGSSGGADPLAVSSIKGAANPTVKQKDTTISKLDSLASRLSSQSPDIGQPQKTQLHNREKSKLSGLSKAPPLKITTDTSEVPPSPSNKPKSPSSSSSSSSSSPSGPRMSKSLAFKRPARFAATRRRPASPLGMSNSGDGDIDPDDEDGSDSDTAFLPFSDPRAAGAMSSKSSDPASTLRATKAGKRPVTESAAESSTSSANSSAMAGVSDPTSPRHLIGSVSPTFSRAAQNRAPPARGSAHRKAAIKTGSEGTPTSMGSSFSDLDDAGVSKSGAEEALANKGNVTSRIGTFSQALRSRYL